MTKEVINEQIIKNWVTVHRCNVQEALKWARNYSQYITNDYAVIGGRTEHYQKGDDGDNFDFFWTISEPMEQFKKHFGFKE